MTSSAGAPARPRRAPRWLVVLGWSAGPASAYVLLSLAHAGLVERQLTVDIGFGRTLAFWVTALYIGLPLWGFLPSGPGGWYARPYVVFAWLAVGAAGLITACGFTIAWLPRHWVSRVGWPVVACLALMVIATGVTLWVASRSTSGRRSAPEQQHIPPAADSARLSGS